MEKRFRMSSSDSPAYTKWVAFYDAESAALYRSFKELSVYKSATTAEKKAEVIRAAQTAHEAENKTSHFGLSMHGNVNADRPHGIDAVYASDVSLSPSAGDIAVSLQFEMETFDSEREMAVLFNSTVIGGSVTLGPNLQGPFSPGLFGDNAGAASLRRLYHPDTWVPYIKRFRRLEAFADWRTLLEVFEDLVSEEQGTYPGVITGEQTSVAERRLKKALTAYGKDADVSSFIYRNMLATLDHLGPFADTNRRVAHLWQSLSNDVATVKGAMSSASARKVFSIGGPSCTVAADGGSPMRRALRMPHGVDADVSFLGRAFREARTRGEKIGDDADLVSLLKTYATVFTTEDALYNELQVEMFLGTPVGSELSVLGAGAILDASAAPVYSHHPAMVEEPDGDAIAAKAKRLFQEAEEHVRSRVHNNP